MFATNIRPINVLKQSFAVLFQIERNTGLLSLTRLTFDWMRASCMTFVSRSPNADATFRVASLEKKADISIDSYSSNRECCFFVSLSLNLIF